MRPCLFVALVLSVAGLPAAAVAAAVKVSAPLPACRVAAPRPAAEPPAWVLLAGAVAALGAGRLAAR